MNSSELRSAIVAEARSWLGTPYHHQGAVKGAGVDCLMLLLRVYQTFGYVPRDFDPRPYVPDWHLHRSEENYLNGVSRFGTRVEMPQPGDIALYRFGRTYSHAAIVVDWPTIVHAHRPDGAVVLGDGRTGDLAGRQALFFTVIGEH